MPFLDASQEKQGPADGLNRACRLGSTHSTAKGVRGVCFGSSSGLLLSLLGAAFGSVWDALGRPWALFGSLWAALGSLLAPFLKILEN